MLGFEEFPEPDRSPPLGGLPDHTAGRRRRADLLAVRPGRRHARSVLPAGRRRSDRVVVADPQSNRVARAPDRPVVTLVESRARRYRLASWWLPDAG